MRSFPILGKPDTENPEPKMAEQIRIAHFEIWILAPDLMTFANFRKLR